jgi:threonyl-tRNA synthetase
MGRGMVHVHGSVVAVSEGMTYRELLEQARPPGLDGEEVLAVLHDGEVLELFRRVRSGGEVRFLTFADRLGQDVFHHTSTHIMAQAVKRLYPEAKLATGPAVEDGFFYDIDLPVRLGDDDLRAIEAQMAEIVAADYPVVREEWPREDARRFFAERGETYKVEILDGLPEDAVISVYRQGEFVDLCRGPHLDRTGKVRAFRLTHVAGAYWRGDERRPMLQRLYGTSFPDEAQLAAHLARLEEARRRDHRRLGPELKLFFLHDLAPGFVFWLPRGFAVYRALEDLSRSLQAELGYEEVSTPWIFRAELWERSGHLAHYRPNMFLVGDSREGLGVKPMNCPAHCLVFRSQTRSYRDLPLKLAEYGPLSRYERSGTLHGLLRVRGFHQDDAHLFVREDQVAEAIRETTDLLDRIYGLFGLGYEVKLSTRPDEAMGAPETWERAEAALAEALVASGRPYTVAPREGAFYGPKLDFDIIDALGRRWQCATIQLDFQMPERFDLVYVDRDGQHRRPVMIHRAVFGSLERFLGILVEHFAGAFPTWLHPVQVRLLPVKEEDRPYAAEAAARLKEAGVRVEVDDRGETLGWRIRQGQLEKIPYLAVVGERERHDATLVVRDRRGRQERLALGDFLERLGEELRERRLEGGVVRT